MSSVSSKRSSQSGAEINEAQAQALPSPVSLDLTDEAPLDDDSGAGSPLSFVSRSFSPDRSSSLCPMCAARVSTSDVFKEEDSSRAPLGKQSLVVRFRGVSVTVEHKELATGYDTFGKKLLNLLFGVFFKLFNPKRTISKINVLTDVCGYVMPGSMTLVLGPPGSGKSTLLKVIAGTLRPSKRIRLEGVVLYNNSVLSPELAGGQPIAYITPLQNEHLPLLTVRETIEFVQRCAPWRNSMPHLRHDANNVDRILQIFGLREIENERIGTLADGIKDSDRNRLTTAEILMGTYSVLLYDQLSSGQDSLITYDLIQLLRGVVRGQQSAAVLSSLQVSYESYALFDRVIILSDGQIIYQGPRQHAESYFVKLGFKKPDYVDAVTFLQDIAAGNGAQYLKEVPSIDELAHHFKASDHYKDILRVVCTENAHLTSWVETSSGLQVSLEGSDVLVTQIPATAGMDDLCVHVGDKVTGVSIPGREFQYTGSGTPDEAVKVSDILRTSKNAFLQLERAFQEGYDAAPYDKHFGMQQIRSWWLSTWCLIQRNIKFTTRLQTLAFLRIMQALVLGLFTGSLFYHKGGRIDQYEMNSVRTVGFISMMSLMLINMVHVPIHILLHRPVFYKQQAQRLYAVSSYVIAHGVVNLPQSVVEALVYSLSVYFLAGLSTARAVHYFQYFGLIFLTSYLGSTYMILVSAIAPIVEVGTTLAGVFVAINLVLSGTPILPSVIRWYWRWILYTTPTRWGNIIFTSTQIDERYNLPCLSYRSYPFCLFNPTLSLGAAFLKYYELEASGRRLILAYAAIVIFILALIYLTYVAYKRIRIEDKTPSIPRQKTSHVHNESASKVTNLQQAENGGVPTGLKWTTNLSVSPTALSFHKLKFVRSQKVVLDNISGYAKPGTMLALMGSTRSGKLTLLNCIAGRLPPGKLEGEVLVNGFRLDGLTFCRISGFAEKLESHQRFLTVRESVEFSAKLRLGTQVSSTDRVLHVEQVLEHLGLSTFGDDLVGNLKLVTSRIDEVTRKLTIAVELAGNPSILFLEDPTSQLDTVGAREIVRLLQSVALSGRTIISTLDHPTGEAFSLFSDVLILKPGGEQVYFGPVGWECSQVLQYFTSMPGMPPYKDKLNPVTYILEVLGGGIKKRVPPQNFTFAYLASPLHQANEEELENLRKQDKANEVKPIKSNYPASLGMQIAMVFSRNSRYLWRNVRYTFGRLTGVILASLLMGTLYLNIDVQKLLPMTSGSLFPYIQLILMSGLTANNVIPQLGTDMLVYYRENRARMYIPLLYPLSWCVAEAPYLLLATLVYVGIGNGLANLAMDSFSVFVRYWIAMFLFAMAVTHFGVFLTLLCRVPIVAIMAVSISTSIWVASSGVSVPRYNIQFYKWLYWINPYQYAVNILTTAAFSCNTVIPACLACTINVACSGCGCKRLVDLEQKLGAVYGPVMSQFVPAAFVWDRMSKARVIEEYRNSRDFAALAAMVVLFAALACICFVWQNKTGNTKKT